MITQPINSVMRLMLPQNVPLDLDPRFRGYVEELTSAIQQMQSYVEQYCGITQKASAQWAQLTPNDTLLEHQVNRFYCKASETIAYGALVNIWDAGSGVLGIRNANATNNTKPAHGICSTSTGIASGAYGECILLRGLVTSISGLTIGQRYFLSTTDGVIINVEPTAAGRIGQYIGVALGPQLLLIDINLQYVQH